MNRLPFLQELQRRHVYKVGAAYAVAGWLLVQVVTQVFPVYEISAFTQRVIVSAIIAGFPLALLLAWIFDITPQGIVRTESLPADDAAPIAAGSRRGPVRGLNGLLALLLLLAIGYFAAQGLGRLGPAAGAPDGKSQSIAVLPFENLSDDAANAYFAQGIQDEILTRLAGIGALKVISRTSTEKYKSHPDNLKTVAAELGVTTLLEGSVQKSGDTVRVNVQLIEAAADRHLWANTYDRELRNVFAVESEISQDITEALKTRLSPTEASALAAAPTQNAAAYDLFLKAEYDENQARSNLEPASFARADDGYRRALALDPGFALAYSQLAMSLLNRHWHVVPISAAELAEAGAAIDHALALAPELPRAHLARAYQFYYGGRQYEPALAEFQRVLSLSPSDAQAIAGIAFVQRRQGRWDEALASFDRALQIAPRDSGLISSLGETQMLLRRYDAARMSLEHALTIDPNDVNAITNLYLVDLLGAGDVGAARKTAQRLGTPRFIGSNGIGGDVLDLVNAPFYVDVYERRYDDVFKAWDALPKEAGEPQLQWLSARAALSVLSGSRAAMQADCATLQTLLQTPEAQALQRPADRLSRLSWAELCLGHTDAAVTAARAAVDQLPLQQDAYAGAYYALGLAQILAQTGHADEALALIRQLLAIPAGELMTVERLRRDPVWDPLRDDPRFKQLVGAGASAAAEPAQAGARTW